MTLRVIGRNISQVMASRIIQLVSQMKITLYPKNMIQRFNGLFRAVVAGELSQLKTISIQGNPSSISPEELSQVVVSIEECNLGAHITTDLLSVVLDKIIETKDLKLKRLSCNILDYNGQ